MDIYHEESEDQKLAGCSKKHLRIRHPCLDVFFFSQGWFHIISDGSARDQDEASSGLNGEPLFWPGRFTDGLWYSEKVIIIVTTCSYCLKVISIMEQYFWSDGLRCLILLIVDGYCCIHRRVWFLLFIFLQHQKPDIQNRSSDKQHRQCNRLDDKLVRLKAQCRRWRQILRLGQITVSGSRQLPKVVVDEDGDELEPKRRLFTTSCSGKGPEKTCCAHDSLWELKKGWLFTMKTGALNLWIDDTTVLMIKIHFIKLHCKIRNPSDYIRIDRTQGIVMWRSINSQWRCLAFFSTWGLCQMLSPGVRAGESQLEVVKGLVNGF